MLFCLAAWLPPVSWLRAAVYLAIGLAAALAVIVLTGPRLFRVVLRPLARLPFLTRAHTDSAAAGVWRGLVSVRRPVPALVAFTLTTVSWVLFGLSNWLVLEGFSLGLSPLAGILVSIALSLAMILPSAPASIGDLRGRGADRAEALRRVQAGRPLCGARHPRPQPLPISRRRDRLPTPRGFWTALRSRWSGRAWWPSWSSKPVRRGSPTLGRFDSGAAPLSQSPWCTPLVCHGARRASALGTASSDVTVASRAAATYSSSASRPVRFHG